MYIILRIIKLIFRWTAGMTLGTPTTFMAIIHIRFTVRYSCRYVPIFWWMQEWKIHLNDKLPVLDWYQKRWYANEKVIIIISPCIRGPVSVFGSAPWKHFSITASYFEQAVIRFSCLAITSAGEQSPRQNSGTFEASQHSLGVGTVNGKIWMNYHFDQKNIGVDLSVKFQQCNKNIPFLSSISTRRYFLPQPFPLHLSIATAIKMKRQKIFISIKDLNYW